MSRCYIHGEYDDGEDGCPYCRDAEQVQHEHLEAIEDRLSSLETKISSPGDYECPYCHYKSLKRNALRCPFCRENPGKGYWDAVSEREQAAKEKEAAERERRRKEAESQQALAQREIARQSDATGCVPIVVVIAIAGASLLIATGSETPSTRESGIQSMDRPAETGAASPSPPSYVPYRPPPSTPPRLEENARQPASDPEGTQAAELLESVARGILMADQALESGDENGNQEAGRHLTTSLEDIALHRHLHGLTPELAALERRLRAKLDTIKRSCNGENVVNRARGDRLVPCPP